MPTGKPNARYTGKFKQAVIEKMRKNSCLDNAVIEDFFGLLKSELLYLQEFKLLEYFTTITIAAARQSERACHLHFTDSKPFRLLNSKICLTLSGYFSAAGFLHDIHAFGVSLLTGAR